MSATPPAPAPENRPRPAAAWLAFSATMTAQVAPVADRADLTVTVAPGAGRGAPACFVPASAVSSPKIFVILAKASSSRSWGAQPVSPLACRVARLRAAVIARESMPSDRASSKSVATSNWKEKRLDRASVSTAPCTPGLCPATT